VDDAHSAAEIIHPDPIITERGHFCGNPGDHSLFFRGERLFTGVQRSGSDRENTTFFELELDPATEEYIVTVAASVTQHFIYKDRAVGMVVYGQAREVLQIGRAHV
jgi:hypothetical protein